MDENNSRGTLKIGEYHPSAKGKYMINWIKEIYKRYIKAELAQNENENLYKAKKHALLALSYWEHCAKESDIQIQIEGSSVYVRLGK